MYLATKRCRALLIITFLAITIFSCIPPYSEPLFICIRAIDGDTIELSNGFVVRYIGIDTPEVDEPLGKEATEYNRKLVEGNAIRLEYDNLKKDQYGRTLAYVYLEDGTFVNCELIRLGYAEIATYKQNLKPLDLLIECQWEAINNGLGIWVGVSEQDIVYTTATGEKYHLEGCRYLKKSSIPITRQEAISRGYTPCSVCKP